jgi:hypothetical protein
MTLGLVTPSKILRSTYLGAVLAAVPLFAGCSAETSDEGVSAASSELSTRAAPGPQCAGGTLSLARAEALSAGPTTDFAELVAGSPGKKADLRRSGHLLASAKHFQAVRTCSDSGGQTRCGAWSAAQEYVDASPMGIYLTSYGDPKGSYGAGLYETSSRREGYTTTTTTSGAFALPLGLSSLASFDTPLFSTYHFIEGTGFMSQGTGDSYRGSIRAHCAKLWSVTLRTNVSSSSWEETATIYAASY